MLGQRGIKEMPETPGRGRIKQQGPAGRRHHDPCEEQSKEIQHRSVLQMHFHDVPVPNVQRN